MAGAFTGLADDWTAIPGGIEQKTKAGWIMNIGLMPLGFKCPINFKS